jgi:hypothetical protein
MTVRRLMVRLRYRPASDILTGTVELGGLPVLETLETAHDADSTVHWARIVDPDTSCPDPNDTSDTLEVLSSFHLIHARALVRAGSLPGLPADLVPHLSAVMQSGISSLRDDAPTLERVQARAEASVALSLRQLRRPDEGAVYAPAQWSSDPADRRQASASLRRLSSALSASRPPRLESLPYASPRPSAASAPLAYRSPAPPPPPARSSGRADRVARLIDELATVLDTSDGLAAPGTSAAAALAADDEPSLSGDDREILGRALRNMASPTTWRQASNELDVLAEHLEHEGPAT